eukprot:381627-Rhodomonas_salina.1
MFHILLEEHTAAAHWAAPLFVEFIRNREMEQYIAPSLLRPITEEEGEEAVDMSDDGAGSTQLDATRCIGKCYAITDSQADSPE